MPGTGHTSRPGDQLAECVVTSHDQTQNGVAIDLLLPELWRSKVRSKLLHRTVHKRPKLLHVRWRSRASSDACGLLGDNCLFDSRRGCDPAAHAWSCCGRRCSSGFQGGDYRQAAAAVAGPDRCLSSAIVLQCLEDLMIHCLPHIPSHIHVVASAEGSSSHAVQVLLAVEATIAAQRGVIRAWLGTL
jgi:hypothetical protein